MKALFTIFTLLVLVASSAYAQQPAKPALEIPEILKSQFAILNAAYPKVEAKRYPKPPADSVWLFRSATAAAGTVEVGFQGKEVIYMVFRRGTGGTGWKPAEIRAIHIAYHKELLKEEYFPYPDRFTKYNDSVVAQINAAVITKKDFDVKALLTGN